jgi:hypothetical protein
VTVYDYSSFAAAEFVQGSSLLPLGGHVLTWDSEYLALAGLFAKVRDRFVAVTGATMPYVLDFEFKKDRTEGLVLKQVRTVPQTDPSGEPTPAFLLDEAFTFCLAQGEISWGRDVFANHRTKMRWSTHTRNLAINEANLASSLFVNTTLTYNDGAGTATLTGSPAEWPEAKHGLEGSAADQIVFDTWTVGTAERRRTYRTEAHLAHTVPAGQVPIMSLVDGWRQINGTITWDVPQPAPVWDDPNNGVREYDNFTLRFCPPEGRIENGSVRREVEADAGGKNVHSVFWYAPPQTGYDKTWAFGQWEATVLTGFIAEPVALTSDVAQSFAPEHHNFVEYMLLEPGLDPGVTAAQKAALQAANVFRVWLRLENYGGNTMKIQGFDGTWRDP